MIITDEAKEAFKTLFHQYESENIRVYFAGQGEGSPEIGLSFDVPEDNDVIQTINSIKVAIDPQILFVAEELTLDVQDTPEGRGIVITGGPEQIM
ncbi:iron-sulfur cluster assembly accessory protein [Jeotgalibacillus terrae]|uniref:HesB-like (Seleno)protein n=1 Tax=Jeotgalibacillus terrae TaxID=587735 RepID=A0ABW5ZH80_9BACL|nr:adhesin [Jeotgalibacillus terrae]MBM7580277.1 Fe-S cluster assembly iron-binding protein IscA [Jeotgalibacillus terrae]